jgi:hypothetical protein
MTFVGDKHHAGESTVNFSAEIPWSEIRRGAWEARCQCAIQYHYEQIADYRLRLDPLDPAMARHLGQCELASETDSAVLGLALKVKPGLGGDYDWFECAGCDCGSPVAHYAVEGVG